MGFFYIFAVTNSPFSHRPPFSLFNLLLLQQCVRLHAAMLPLQQVSGRLGTKQGVRARQAVVVSGTAWL